MRTVWLGLLGLVLAGCPTRVREPAHVDAGASGAVDAGLPQDGALSFEVMVDGLPVRVVDGVAEVESGAMLGLTGLVALADFRVRLFDPDDRVVPSDDTAEVADGGLNYLLQLVEPLKPGRRYVLVLDAQVGPRVSDTAGRPYEDLRVVLQVRGDAPPSPPAQRKRRGR